MDAYEHLVEIIILFIYLLVNTTEWLYTEVGLEYICVYHRHNSIEIIDTKANKYTVTTALESRFY